MKYTAAEIAHMRVLVRDMITPTDGPYSPSELDNQVELYVGTYIANGTTLEELKRHREERLNRTVRTGA